MQLSAESDDFVPELIDVLNCLPNNACHVHRTTWWDTVAPVKVLAKFWQMHCSPDMIWHS
jgi:hypothetical protein